MENQKKMDIIQSALVMDNLEQIVNRCAVFLNNPLVIITTAYNIIAHSTCIPVSDETWNNATKRGYITLEFAATLNNWDNIKDLDTDKKYECLTVTKITNLRRKFYKLEIKGTLLGYLNITEVHKNFDQVSEEDYHFVAQVIAKELFLHQSHSQKQIKGIKEDIVVELISNTYVDRIHFMERVKMSELQVNSTYQILASDLTNFFSYNANDDRFKEELLYFFPSGTIAIFNKVLIILIDCQSYLYKDFKGDKKLDKYLKSKKLTLGISDYFTDLFEFKRFENQAVFSFHHKNQLPHWGCNFVFYEQVKIYDLLRQIPKSNLIYFCNQKVKAVYDYDLLHGTAYFDTLHKYLLCDKSVQNASELMFLHRNTINYRISKLKELFEIDFDDSSLVNHLLVGCQILIVYYGNF